MREPRRTALPGGSQSRGFVVMRLVSGWSLASHSNSESFIQTVMDAGERDSGKWMGRQCLLSTFPKLLWLVVAY